MPRRFSAFLAIPLVLAAFLAARDAASAAQYQVVHSFAGGATDGDSPAAGLTLSGSTLYGTTFGGGTGNSGNNGTVFSMNLDGTGFHVIHSFSANGDGWLPQADITLVGTRLFGTTSQGGFGHTSGAVFSMNIDGSGYQILHSFTGGSDSSHPLAGLTLLGSTLFGTTGGQQDFGSVFSINTDGSGFRVLHSFAGTPTDGSFPEANLAAIGSTLYGTTTAGGTAGNGALFAINADGSGFRILHSFNGSDGNSPYAPLTAVGSTLFGTTFRGGSESEGIVFSINADGSAYKVLHTFGIPASDSAHSPVGLTLVDSTLYGLTASGGTSGGWGTVFALNTDGTGYHLVHSFAGAPLDGGHPYFSSLTVAGSTLYGTTISGGQFGEGIVFSIEIPEPSSLMLASIGFALIALVACGRRKLR